MEKRARELINPLDLGCEALREKVIKIFIQALKEEHKITRHACAESANNVVKFLGITEAEYQSRIHSAIMNVNTEKGDE